MFYRMALWNDFQICKIFQIFFTLVIVNYLSLENKRISLKDFIAQSYDKALDMSGKCSSSSFEGHPLQARHKQDWDRGFILLLSQTAVLPGSDAGSDAIKPASSFVIQNRQTSCSMWCPMYRAHC